MAQPKIPEIETERLVLRGPTDEDIEAWAVFLVDPGDFRYMPWLKSDETPQQRAKRNLDAMAQRWETRPLSAMGWVIARKDDGQLIGTGGLEQVQDSNDGEIDYRLGKQFWGRGYASEAARAITRFGFENSAWERIVAYVVPENTASVRIAQGLGMAYEKDVNYLDLLGDLNVEIASPITALYAIARDQFTPGDAIYRVRLAPGH
jgi:RimJ/RimL family protein N-acetyltransferase